MKYNLLLHLEDAVIDDEREEIIYIHMLVHMMCKGNQ